jgi:hypothetical protein
VRAALLISLPIPARGSIDRIELSALRTLDVHVCDSRSRTRQIWWLGLQGLISINPFDPLMGDIIIPLQIQAITGINPIVTFARTATGYDSKPGIKWLSCTAK